MSQTPVNTSFRRVGVPLWLNVGLWAQPTLAILFSSAILIRLAFFFHTSDDAFITFRYVHNLSAGEGLVYNPGEKVLGTTTPLFSLLLCLPGILRLDFIFWGKILGSLGGALSCCMVYLIVKSERSNGEALLAGLLCALSHNLAVWSSSGMETGVFTCLALSSIYLYINNRETSCGILLGLTILTRPDGALLFIIIFLRELLYSRRIPWRLLVTCGVILSAWGGFSIYYYGSLLPASAVAKAVAYRGTPEATSLGQKLGIFFSKPDKIIFSALALWAVTRMNFINHRGSVLYVWAALHYAAILVSSGHIFDWYYSPVLPAYLVLVAVGTVDLAGRTFKRARFKIPYVPQVIITILILFSIARLGYTWIQYRTVQRTYQEVHQAIGLWLKENSESGQRILVGDIGYIGYYSGRRIIDWMGLVSPEILPYHQQGRPEEVPLELSPDFIVLGAYDYLFDRTAKQPWFNEK